VLRQENPKVQGATKLLLMHLQFYIHGREIYLDFPVNLKTSHIYKQLGMLQQTMLQRTMLQRTSARTNRFYQ
jgi:hypothetical protein